VTAVLEITFTILAILAKHSPNSQNTMTNILENVSLVSIQKMLGEYFRSGESQSKTKKGLFGK